MSKTVFQPTFPGGGAPGDTRARRPGLRHLLALLVLVAVAPLLLVAWLDGARAQDARLHQATQAIDLLARGVADAQSRTLGGTGQLLGALASSPVLNGGDAQACARLLQRVLGATPGLVQLGVIDLDGRVLCQAGAGAVGEGLGARREFRRALATGGLVMGAALAGSATGGEALVLARPVRTDTGQVKAVLYAALGRSGLVQGLGAVGAVAGACIQIADAAGAVLAFSPVAVPPGELPGLLRATATVRIEGEGQLLVTAVLATEAVTAPLQRALWRRLGGLLALALAMGALVWGLGERLLARPLERLVKGLRDVEAGDYGVALGQSDAALAELVQLRYSLGSLVAGLEAQRAERDHALGALSEREARYRELFRLNPHAMYVYDIRSLRLLAANDAALAFYGYCEAEMFELTLLDLRPAFEHSRLLAQLTDRSRVATDPVPGIWIHQKRNGDLAQVEILSSATLFDGVPARLVMVTDVTARLAAEARVNELTGQLELRVAERTRALQLANEELEAFSYSVSHDLRNPLDAVAMFGQMLSDQLGDTLDAQARLCLTRMDQGVRGMQKLIDDLLSLAQVTRAELKMGPVDLSALSHDVLQDLRDAAPGRAVTVVVDEGLRCTGDARLLRLVMANLLGNAWKFTANTDGALIHVGRQASTGAASEPIFFVADNGAGFDMKFAGRLFLPFERLHGDQDYPGAGIGLATVRRVLARHGGRIWAESAPGQGATFRFVVNLPKVL